MLASHLAQSPHQTVDRLFITLCVSHSVVELGRPESRFFLAIRQVEHNIQIVAESSIANHRVIFLASILFLDLSEQSLVYHHFHGLENYTSEFVSLDQTLTQRIEVLEILTVSKTIQLSSLSQLKKNVLDILRNRLLLTSSSLQHILHHSHVSKIKRLSVLQKV